MAIKRVTDLSQGENVMQDRLNPWISICTQPRKTIRYVIDSYPYKYVYIIASLYAIFESLNKASSKGLGEQLPIWGILAIAIIGGVIWGYISLYILGGIVKWTGRWIGGTGVTTDITVALAWGSLPYIYTSILWIPDMIVYGKELFMAQMQIDFSIGLIIYSYIRIAISIIASIWTIIIVTKCLGEVQGFSAWKALGNVILAGLVIVIPIAIIMAIPS